MALILLLWYVNRYVRVFTVVTTVCFVVPRTAMLRVNARAGFGETLLQK